MPKDTDKPGLLGHNFKGDTANINNTTNVQPIHKCILHLYYKNNMHLITL